MNDEIINLLSRQDDVDLEYYVPIGEKIYTVELSKRPAYIEHSTFADDRTAVEVKISFKNLTLFHHLEIDHEPNCFKIICHFLKIASLFRTGDLVYLQSTGRIVRKTDVDAFNHICKEIMGDRSNCTICDDISKELSKCGHNVCKLCYEMLSFAKVCPICRSEFVYLGIQYKNDYDRDDGHDEDLLHIVGEESDPVESVE